MKAKIKKLGKKKAAQTKSDAMIAEKSAARRANPDSRISWADADKSATKTIKTFEKKAKEKKGLTN